MNDIEISFPGGKRVDAQVGTHVVRTDQPTQAGGLDSAAAPSDLFLASLGTCAGIYALGFCQARGLPTEGLAMRQHHEVGPDGHLERVELTVTLPPGFPPRYREAILRAAAECKVKRTLVNPPEIRVRAEEAAPAAEPRPEAR